MTKIRSPRPRRTIDLQSENHQFARSASLERDPRSRSKLVSRFARIQASPRPSVQTDRRTLSSAIAGLSHPPEHREHQPWMGSLKPIIGFRKKPQFSYLAWEVLLRCQQLLRTTTRCTTNLTTSRIHGSRPTPYGFSMASAATRASGTTG